MSQERITRLPPDEFELRVYKTGLDEDNPRKRLAGLTSAVRHLEERIEAVETTGTVYVAERQLLLQGQEINLSPHQMQLLLYLTNREALVPVEELSERMGTNNVDIVITAGRVKGILKRSGFGEAYLQSEKGGYFLAPLLEVENIKPDTIKTFTCGEAAKLSSLEPGFVKQLCQKEELMLPEAHFVSNNGRLIILPQGLQRLRVIKELTGKGIRLNSSWMKYEIEERSPVREALFQRAKREFLEVLSQALSPEEEEKIDLLKHSLSLEKLASFVYDKGAEKPTARELARIRMLMPYIEFRVAESRGSLTSA